MRTYTIEKTVYSYSELSEKAQQRAYEDYVNNEQYHWHDENVTTLEKFCDGMPIDYRRIEFEYGGGREYINFNRAIGQIDECITDLRGVRLATYLWNNHAKHFLKGKFYSTQGKHINGKYTYKSRHSKIQKVWTDCPLTGYCMDVTILEPLFAFIAHPTSQRHAHWDITDIIDACLNEWLAACASDYEHAHSKTAFLEHIDANNYEFTADGRLS